MHEFFAFQPPPTTIPRHRAQWVDAVLATWRTIAEDNRTGAALIRAVRDEVDELEQLQHKLFGVTSPAPNLDSIPTRPDSASS